MLQKGCCTTCREASCRRWRPSTPPRAILSQLRDVHGPVAFHAATKEGRSTRQIAPGPATPKKITPLGREQGVKPDARSSAGSVYGPASRLRPSIHRHLSDALKAAGRRQSFDTADEKMQCLFPMPESRVPNSNTLRSPRRSQRRGVYITRSAAGGPLKKAREEALRSYGSMTYARPQEHGLRGWSAQDTLAPSVAAVKMFAKTTPVADNPGWGQPAYTINPPGRQALDAIEACQSTDDQGVGTTGE